MFAVASCEPAELTSRSSASSTGAGNVASSARRSVRGLTQYAVRAQHTGQSHSHPIRRSTLAHLTACRSVPRRITTRSLRSHDGTRRTSDAPRFARQALRECALVPSRAKHPFGRTAHLPMSRQTGDAFRFFLIAPSRTPARRRQPFTCGLLVASSAQVTTVHGPSRCRVLRRKKAQPSTQVSAALTVS